MNDLQEKRISGLLLKIDRSTCIATTNCKKVAPEIFELDEENIISFKGNGDVDSERLIEACSVCPVNALYVIDKEGNQLVP
ncbi:MAG: ferredoxin [Ignavibacteriales bacterium]|nr:MAG: ferredoxin [Ignavibacteriales bacterium]